MVKHVPRAVLSSSPSRVYLIYVRSTQMENKRYVDPWTRATSLMYTVTHFHESFESEYQRIDVFEAEDWGTVLALGGVTNVTDRDESSYHEMLAHVPLLIHPEPRRVLIIGGGDGGTLREVLRHPEVEHATLVDIDGEVIRCARAYFPRLAEAFDHPKAEVIVGDGLAYVASAAERGESFDVILVDSTDPVDAAVELFTEAFYASCARLLGDTGILVPQSDSPTFCIDRVVSIQRTLDRVFKHARPYLGQTVAYPGGLWAYTMATNGVRPAPTEDAHARLARFAPELRYLNGDMFDAAFALPSYIHRAMGALPPVDMPAICDDPNTFGAGNAD